MMEVPSPIKVQPSSKSTEVRLANYQDKDEVRAKTMPFDDLDAQTRDDLDGLGKNTPIEDFYI